MGFLVKKNFFIEGYFARLMYRSLYKMHEAALRTRERDPRYNCPNLSPTQCARGKASLEPIRAKRSTFDRRFHLTIRIHCGTLSYVQQSAVCARTAAQHSSSDVPIASDAAREPQALLPSARRPLCPWPEPMEETMRVTKRAVAAREQSWPLYFAGSRANLQNIRRALAPPELRS
jgi:hypothetical protein